MKEILRKLTASLDTHTKDGFSARKLSAFILMACIVSAQIAWIKKAFMESDFTLLPEMTMIDGGLVLSLLGLTVYEKIKGKSDAPAA